MLRPPVGPKACNGHSCGFIRFKRASNLRNFRLILAGVAIVFCRRSCVFDFVGGCKRVSVGVGRSDRRKFGENKNNP